jgi:hypothetical protein
MVKLNRIVEKGGAIAWEVQQWSLMAGAWVGWILPFHQRVSALSKITGQKNPCG